MPAIPRLPKFKKMKKKRIAAVVILLLIVTLFVAAFLLHLLPSPASLGHLLEPKATADPLVTFAAGKEPIRTLMNPPLIPGFSMAPEGSYSPLTLRFIDFSRGSPATWHWDLGDGSTSSEQNPVHAYAKPGTYTVTQTVTRADGSVRSASRHDVLGAERPPSQQVLADTLREAIVKKGAEVTFVTAGENSSVMINGNGIALPIGSAVRMRTASDADPSGRMSIRSGRLVSFAFPDVTLFVNGIQAAHGAGGDCILPAAEYFTVNLTYSIRPTIGEMRQIVIDGTKIRSGMENSLIRISYNTHAVSGDLTLITYPAYFEGEASSFQLSDAVIASFDPDETTTGPAPFAVQFQDTSAGHPERWEWSFGDGTTSDQQHPVHVYAQPGAYAVMLKVTRGDQTDTIIRKTAVIAEPPRVLADFSAGPVIGPAPLTVKFSDRSTNAPTMWIWTFGPNSTPLNSTEQNPVVTYSDPGTYTVFLTSGNVYGSSDITRPQLVTVSDPFHTPDKAIIVRTGKRGYIEKNSVVEFVVLNRPASISMNGGDRQLMQGDVVRLVAMSDQQGEIYIDRGEILKFSFPDMALYVNGELVADGSIDSIYIPASGDFRTSLSYYLVPNSAYTYVAVSGYEVLGDLDNAWIRISNIGMNDGGNLRLISSSSSTYIDGAAYDTVHDWVIE
jgi:PKD repeat protein